MKPIGLSAVIAAVLVAALCQVAQAQDLNSLIPCNTTTKPPDPMVILGLTLTSWSDVSGILALLAMPALVVGWLQAREASSARRVALMCRLIDLLGSAQARRRRGQAFALVKMKANVGDFDDRELQILEDVLVTFDQAYSLVERGKLPPADLRSVAGVMIWRSNKAFGEYVGPLCERLTARSELPGHDSPIGKGHGLKGLLNYLGVV